MAADVITRFRLETTQYDSKLRDAAKGLKEFTHQAQLGGKNFTDFSQKAVESARALGTVASGAMNTKEKVRDLVGAYNEAAKAYSSLSQAQQEHDFGKNLAASLETLKVRITEAKQELYGLGDTMGKSGGGLFAGLGDKMSGALQVFAGNMLTKAAGAVANLGSEMYGMAQQGIELAKQGEGIRNAFERLGRGDILDGLRQATHGTVTDLELMKAAVKFNDFKLPLDELGTMLAFAQQKAKDTGQSVDYMVDSIVTGLGRKSLMILDNLGLSASEIKERMAETGDMTKAVGAIIRDQMAKAGDYVETAADRATKADVDLKNAMDALGRTLMPLQEAGVSLFTSWETSALKFIKNALEPLIARFTEAGRLQAAYNRQGGSEKVDRMENTLRNTSADRRQGLYNTQVNNFNRFIKERQDYINLLNSYRAGSRGEGNGYTPANKARIDQLFKRFGTDDTSRLQSQIDGATKQLQGYQKVAKEILKPAEANIDTSGAEQSVESLKVKLIELEAQRKKAIAAGDTELSKNLAKQITQTKADIKGLGGTTTTRTTATPKTEEQQNAARIAEMVKQYQDLATAAKTADDAQKAGLTERMAKIQGEIKTLEDRNTELKKFADEARQVQYPVGSLPQLNEQLKTLQAEQAKALDAKQWKDYQQQIEQTQYQIDALKGKWQDGLQATFKLNIEQQGNTDINTSKPDDITVTFKADDADVLAKLRYIEGVNIDPKTLTVTAQTQEAIAALQRVDGLTLQPKTAEVTFRADDADVLAKLRDIEGVEIDPKTLTVTANTSEAIAALQRVDGLTIQPKTAGVTFRADDSDVLAKLRDIDGVTIDDKTLTVTAETQEANEALQRVDGLALQPKTAEVTFRADDADVLAKLRDIEGITIDDKTLTVTANTADAYNKVQELLKSVDGKPVAFTVQPKMDTGTSIQNDAGMSSYITSIKHHLETADYGTSLYNGLSAQLADMTALQNLVGESLKAGLGTAIFGAADATGKDFWTRAMEGSVEDTDWQAIVEKINEALKAAGLDTISLDFKTGDVEDKTKEMTKDWNSAASAIQSVGQAMNQIEDPAAKVMGTIAQAIATISLTFAKSLEKTVGPWNWIAAAAAGTTTMISTIAAIHSATGYANGGIVDGRAGGFVGGTAYSGDNIGNVKLDSGELVLNKSQQSNLASALEGSGMQNLQLSATISGEDIKLALNNNSRRTGRGEYVTTRFQQ